MASIDVEGGKLLVHAYSRVNGVWQTDAAYDAVGVMSLDLQTETTLSVPNKYWIEGLDSHTYRERYYRACVDVGGALLRIAINTENVENVAEIQRVPYNDEAATTWYVYPNATHENHDGKWFPVCLAVDGPYVYVFDVFKPDTPAAITQRFRLVRRQLDNATSSPIWEPNSLFNYRTSVASEADISRIDIDGYLLAAGNGSAYVLSTRLERIWRWHGGQLDVWSNLYDVDMFPNGSRGIVADDDYVYVFGAIGDNGQAIFRSPHGSTAAFERILHYDYTSSDYVSFWESERQIYTFEAAGDYLFFSPSVGPIFRCDKDGGNRIKSETEALLTNTSALRTAYQSLTAIRDTAIRPDPLTAATITISTPGNGVFQLNTDTHTGVTALDRVSTPAIDADLPAIALTGDEAGMAYWTDIVDVFGNPLDSNVMFRASRSNLDNREQFLVDFHPVDNPSGWQLARGPQHYDGHVYYLRDLTSTSEVRRRPVNGGNTEVVGSSFPNPAAVAGVTYEPQEYIAQFRVPPSNMIYLVFHSDENVFIYRKDITTAGAPEEWISQPLTSGYVVQAQVVDDYLYWTDYQWRTPNASPKVIYRLPLTASSFLEREQLYRIDNNSADWGDWLDNRVKVLFTPWYTYVVPARANVSRVIRFETYGFANKTYINFTPIGGSARSAVIHYPNNWQPEGFVSVTPPPPIVNVSPTFINRVSRMTEQLETAPSVEHLRGLDDPLLTDRLDASTDLRHVFWCSGLDDKIYVTDPNTRSTVPFLNQMDSSRVIRALTVDRERHVGDSDGYFTVTPTVGLPRGVKLVFHLPDRDDPVTGTKKVTHVRVLRRIVQSQQSRAAALAKGIQDLEGNREYERIVTVTERHPRPQLGEWSWTDTKVRLGVFYQYQVQPWSGDELLPTVPSHDEWVT